MGYYILDTQILVLGSENIEQELLKRIDTITVYELLDIADKWQYLDDESECTLKRVRECITRLFKMLKEGAENLDEHRFKEYTIYVAILTTADMEGGCMAYRLFNMIYCLPDRILDGIIADYLSPRKRAIEDIKHRAEVDKEEILDQFEPNAIVIERRCIHERLD